MKFIVAVDQEWGFSKNKLIPWSYPEDFQFFKNQTQGSVCVMGYHTYAKLAQMRKYPLEKKVLLSHRQCIVLTSRKIDALADVKICHHLSEVPSLDNLYWIGGKSIYDHALTVCKEGWITRIKHTYNCDTFFNSQVLEQNFYCDAVIHENEEMRFEHWTHR